MKYTYCAIFKKSLEGGYEVAFPDIFGGVTCGDNFDDAKMMATDLLKLMLSSAKGQCFEPHNKDFFERNLEKDEMVVEITVSLEK